MITTDRLIEIAAAAAAHGRDEGDRARAFFCLLVGNVQHAEGMERADALALALDFGHLVERAETPA